MSTTENNINFSLKIAIILLITVLVVYSMIAMRSLLIPLAFSIFLIILINQLFLRLESWGLGHIWTIVSCLVATSALVYGFIRFIYIEIVHYIRYVLQSFQL
jgi:predicted PurR-regulated permease PerM